MGKQCQTIIPARKCSDIVLERVRINHNTLAGNQSGNRVLQPFLIHIDIGRQRSAADVFFQYDKYLPELTAYMTEQELQMERRSPTLYPSYHAFIF